MVGFHQLDQPGAHARGILGNRHVKKRGVADDPRPVPLESKGDATGDPQRAEHAPAGEQADLPAGEHRIGGGMNAVVVKDETV